MSQNMNRTKKNQMKEKQSYYFSKNDLGNATINKKNRKENQFKFLFVAIHETKMIILFYCYCESHSGGNRLMQKKNIKFDIYRCLSPPDLCRFEINNNKQLFTKKKRNEFKCLSK